MTANTILDYFAETSSVTNEMVSSLLESQSLGKELVSILRKNKNREFALKLLVTTIQLRKSPEGIDGDIILQACYILGLHNMVEDSLKIWEAKNTDFDMYCYIDIELTVFAGVDETLNYLETQDSDKARAAFNYISESKKAGCFDAIEDYFSETEMPWYI